MFLVLSASLHPDSRSRILAHACVQQLQSQGRDAILFDLSRSPLPPCDGATAYGDANVQQLSSLVEASEAIFVASPVYNYDVSAATKNAVELTGRAWTEKIVSIMLAAGGHGSYMSAMGLANSLMLDFRCLIVPRFLYVTGDSFDEATIVDATIEQRLRLMVQETTRLADAVNSTTANRP